jgi:hypothetical protein
MRQRKPTGNTSREFLLSRATHTIRVGIPSTKCGTSGISRSMIGGGISLAPSYQDPFLATFVA